VPNSRLAAFSLIELPYYQVPGCAEL